VTTHSREYYKQWRLKNLDKRRAIEKRYRETHREQLRKASKRYCDRHRKKRRASANRWYHANKTYVAVKKRRQHLADPSRRRAQQLKHKYGMTLEAFQQIIKAQKNRCEACGARFTPRGKFKACVDHDHNTGTKKRGEPRGVICNRCNWVLGQVADDLKVLSGLETYLKKRST
jgi:hypothetical protein